MQDIAVVIGASGGIGSAIREALQRSGGYERVIGFSRSTDPALDLLNEDSIRACAEHVAALSGELRLVFDATGALTLDGARPEKSWRDLSPDLLARSFAVNAIGPALLLKHFLPLLPKEGRCVFATLSARVGSISDNRLGGWYAYRASKAALNQLVRTAAVELARKRPEAVCVALHPGTVRTRLTEGFAKSGLEVQEPDVAAERLLTVLDGLAPEQSGGFFDHLGKPVPW
ncbi:SDR family NAD(P)-dependent oxidoreductase [Roseibium sediminicola]|uniref:SDR family oxidoreductase n=1 Tax=Roseibium sediminicola TaxID=2933272 RepID=A0ABT0GRU6_9HYPH|nr:SDR family NAD(P)-dependent oxidoreductase [Roseibium sp. CAU 1639]MCK7612170.1 SDR family oxidoreductase [Roseibium sp. CAU 1639]